LTGQGIMVIAFFDEHRGFGLTLTDEEVDKINEQQFGKPGKVPISYGESPGLVFFQYGKNKDGYWDGALFEKQCEDVIDCFEILYPGMQLLVEVDHSSGHLKEQGDGLEEKKMGVKWGGKFSAKRDTVIEEGCLGESPPIINGVQLSLGMTQTMVFREGDPPPFLDPKANPHAVPMNEAQIVKEKLKRLNAKKKADEEIAASTSPVAVANATAAAAVALANVEAPFIIRGYIGSNKGIYQVLYERGLFVVGMKGKQSQGNKEQLEIQNKKGSILAPHLDANAILGACPDFKHEMTALQRCVESRGHILLPSVVCTPETAGLGIEYAWGKLKYEQRQENDKAAKLESGTKFVARVKVLCQSKTILPLARVYRFVRRTRDYIRMYMELSVRVGSTALTHAQQESMRGLQKTHRNIKDLDSKYLRNN
jgi:hypothetical protein